MNRLSFLATLSASLFAFGMKAATEEFAITVPADAELLVGQKTKHFVDFTEIPVKDIEKGDGFNIYKFDLETGKVYNYRTWMDGGLTQGGYFTMSADASKRPEIVFSLQDYEFHGPKEVNHSVQSNVGYETGDIFVNINPEGFLKLKEGDTFNAHAMRTWELTDNSTNNYFIEPDFHYTVVGLDGQPADDVISIEQKPGSPWATITAIGKGTVIVMVTYDGINLHFYSGAEQKEYMGGSYWGAIWPENTAVYVVSVGEEDSSVRGNMIINEAYNSDAMKNAGKYVDAEHDVFYYLEGEEGLPFRFTPENATAVEIAYPEIGQTVSYDGFSSEGVTDNGDGSYTVLLKKGRQIVRLQDEAGLWTYQVLTAKECQRKIENASREGSAFFQPGDKVKISYNGLFHPANKIAGIYNMSAYVTYNNTPGGTSLIQGSGQYTFGSAESAQAVTLTIPEDFDAENSNEFIISDGVIQVNGYGDPIGNHREIDPQVGRSPNFNAVAHKTYFGMLPDVKIELRPIQKFDIAFQSNVDIDGIKVIYNGEKELMADEEGHYQGSFGTYSVKAGKAGYRCFRGEYIIAEDTEGPQIFEISMVEGPEGVWDGKTVNPVEANEDGVYVVTNGAELAYLQQMVAKEGNKLAVEVELANDIDLGDYDWTPIGDSSKPFGAGFNGNGHTVKGLYIDNTKADNQALFGYVKGTSSHPAVVSNVIVEGSVKGKQYTGGLIGCLHAYSTVDRCANLAEVEGAGSYTGGVIGRINSGSSVTVTNLYNHGNVTGTTQVGGIVGYPYSSGVIKNIYSVGKITSTTPSTTGACIGNKVNTDKVENVYAIEEYGVTDGHTLVTEEEMASGKIAYLLGDAFSQNLGEDIYPVFNAAKVYQDPDDGSFYNVADSFSINPGIGDENVELTGNGLYMQPESVYRLTVDAHPVKGRLPELVWSSSHDDIVKVDHEGKPEATLTALKSGEVEIKAQDSTNPDNYSVLPVVVSTVDGVTEIFGEDRLVDIYDINGRIIMLQAYPTQMRNLTPGLYIMRDGNVEKKVLIRK